MIDGLISGKLHGNPEKRAGKDGKAYVTAKVRTPVANGVSVFVNVIVRLMSGAASLV